MKWLDKIKNQKPILEVAWFTKQDDLFNQKAELFRAKGMAEYFSKGVALELYLRDYDFFNEINRLECKKLRGTSLLFKTARNKLLNQATFRKCIDFISLENQYD